MTSTGEFLLRNQEANNEGYEVVNSFKYLGLKITCDRKKVISDAKAQCKMFFNYLRGKIQTNNEKL